MKAHSVGVKVTTGLCGPYPFTVQCFSCRKHLWFSAVKLLVLVLSEVHPSFISTILTVASHVRRLYLLDFHITYEAACFHGASRQKAGNVDSQSQTPRLKRSEFMQVEAINLTEPGQMADRGTQHLIFRLTYFMLTLFLEYLELNKQRIKNI